MSYHPWFAPPTMARPTYRMGPACMVRLSLAASDTGYRVPVADRVQPGMPAVGSGTDPLASSRTPHLTAWMPTARLRADSHGVAMTPSPCTRVGHARACGQDPGTWHAPLLLLSGNPNPGGLIMPTTQQLSVIRPEAPIPDDLTSTYLLATPWGGTTQSPRTSRHTQFCP